MTHSKYCVRSDALLPVYSLTVRLLQVRPLALVLLAAWLLFPFPAHSEEPLVVAGTLPPLHYVDENGLPAGYSIEVLERIMSMRGKPFDRNSVSFMPWARALDTAAKKDNCILLGTARTADREARFRWVGPVVTLQLGIITRRDGHYRPHSSSDLRSMRIAVVRNSAGAFILKNEHGFTDDDCQFVNSETSQLLMLDNGRVDAIVHTDITTPFAMRSVGVNPDLYEMVYVLRRLPLYFAIHADGNDELAAGMQKTLAELYQERGGETRQFLLRTHLSEQPLQVVAGDTVASAQ